MSGYVVEERDGDFVLPLVGFFCRGFRDRTEGVELLLISPGFEDEASVVINDDAHRPPVASLAAQRSSVSEARVRSDSMLSLEFEDGAVLEVAAGDYEAWEVLGPGPVHVVSPAGGGGPVIWDATTEPLSIRPGDPLPPELVEMIETFGMPLPTGEFELRRSKGPTGSFELGPPRDREET